MKHRLFLLVSIVGLLTYGGLAAASAATASHARASHAKKFCVARAELAGSRAAPTMTCYSTFAASIRAATSGRISLPASARPTSLTPDQLNAGPAVPNTTYVLSIDWADTGFTGASLTWEQSSKCGSFQVSSMPPGWNDVVESVETFSGCANTLYENINFGGSTFSIGRNSSADTLGSFNDKTSSEKWCTAKPCG